MLELRKLTVGPYDMNCYLVVHPDRKAGTLIDPGDEADKILSWIGAIEVECVLLTHGHPDHTGGLDQLRRALSARVGLHAADAEEFGLTPDFFLSDGDLLELGAEGLLIVHIPGHTPGSAALRLVDSHTPPRVIVGDVIFPGGPGHTSSPQALVASLESLARTVFTWSDETELHPGHGVGTTVGAERAAFETFRANPRPTDLHGDVTWR